ncbi:hypothetical protein NECAME_01137 [Necator americanus]|uniref:Uncharacterized protein n=1 Tax=Necator americanus TaxID=51031 RepID=W2SJU7_NECAM|nr:hypothetical protein NECAME_01137 [Necator americanus]ETN69027.1 hypothetical protein NECAME_01137 [Necator americanus]
MAMWGMLKKIFLRHNSSDEEELQNEQSLCDASNVNSEPHAMDGMEDAVEHKPVNESAEATPDSGLHDKNVRKIMRPVMFIWHYLKEK